MASDILIDDFEDNDTDTPSGWDGWTQGGSLGPTFTTTSAALSGNYSGYFVNNSDNTNVQANSTSGNVGGDLSFEVEIDTQTGGDFDGTRIDWDDEDTNLGNSVTFVDNGDIETQLGTVLQTWNTNTKYTVEVEMDFANGEQDIIINGTRYGPFSFVEGFGGVARIFVDNSYFSAGTEVRTKIDEFYVDKLFRPPTNASQVIKGNAEIDLSWTEGAGADSYEIRVSKDGGAFTVFDTVPAGTSSVSYTGLDTSVDTWAWEVYGVQDGSYNGPAATATKSTNITLSLDAIGLTTADFSWGDIDGETGYELLRSETSGSVVGDYTTVSTAGADVASLSDSGLTNGKEYYWRVLGTYPQTDSLSNEVVGVTTLPATDFDTVEEQ